MRSSMLAAGILMAMSVARSAGRDEPEEEPPIAKSGAVAAEKGDDPPSTLPPLLPVAPGSPQAVQGPRGPRGDYDPNYFYLPERAPERNRPYPCGPEGRIWLDSDIELAWLKPHQTPALARLGSLTGPVAFGGTQPSLFNAGYTFAGGFWLNEQRTMGIESNLLVVPRTGTNTLIFSNGSPLLLPTAGGRSFPLADPNLGYAGAYEAGFNSNFLTVDVNYRNNIACTSNSRLDALIGYRFANVDDNGAIYGKRIGPVGEIVRFRDDITTRNNYHAGQIGLAGEYRFEQWFVTGLAKVGFGAMVTETDLEGQFRVNGTVVPNGFYARPGLNGPLDHTRFAVMPVVGVTVGRQLGEHTRVYVGYNFMYLNNLTRAPDVLDPTPTVLNSNPQAPLAPAAAIRRDATTSDFWAQSFSFGMIFRY